MDVAEITQIRTYLTFKLENEVFAVDVAKVHEVLDYVNITKVPRTPEFMKGVINLRGSVVPVMDMRLKFGMIETEKTIDTCIIVMEIDLDNTSLILGALVDSVVEVFELDPEYIEPAPRLGTRYRAELLHGMGKRDDRFIMILNIDKVFSTDELAIVQESDLDVIEEATTEDLQKNTDANDGETAPENIG